MKPPRKLPLYVLLKIGGTEEVSEMHAWRSPDQKKIDTVAMTPAIVVKSILEMQTIFRHQSSKSAREKTTA